MARTLQSSFVFTLLSILAALAVAELLQLPVTNVKPLLLGAALLCMVTALLCVLAEANRRAASLLLTALTLAVLTPYLDLSL